MDTVDFILSGGVVITMNSRSSLFDPGAVAVRGDKIVAVGPADEITTSYEGKVLDCQGKVVMPGLINLPLRYFLAKISNLIQQKLHLQPIQ